MTDLAVPTGTDGRPLSACGARTPARLLEAAERLFAEFGYHDASIVKITEAAGFSGFKQAMEPGEITPGDPEVLAWALVGIGELFGMRWILWAGRSEATRVGLRGTRADHRRMLGAEEPSA